MIEKLTPFYFQIIKNEGEIMIIANTLWNYLILLLAVIGFICCFMNAVLPATIIFFGVFIHMNLKTIIYFQLYKKYSKLKYMIQENGSKYSFKNPQIIKFIKVSSL